MKVEIKIPTMGESIVEVTIGAILKPSGSVVRAEEELIEIETDKVNQVLAAPAAGKLHWNVKSADVVKIGQVIGSIETEGASPQAQQPQSEPKPQTLPKAALPPSPSDRAPARKTVDAALQEMGSSQPKSVSIPNKAASPEPVASTPSDAASGEVRKKMSKLRKVIAQRLVEVKNQTAMLTTFNEVDMSAVMAVREKEQENFQKKHGIKLGFMSFFVKACAAALQEFPDVNARLDKEEIVYRDFVHMGVAVSTEKGLMVPVIRNAHLLSYADIERELKRFAEEARSGTISIDSMQGGTFTITNGGVFGSLLSTPILNPPQSGILGMHNIVKRPVVVDDQIVIRPMMYLALSYDHRVIDGKDSIQFLLHIKKSLEEPARLLLDL